MFTNFFKPTAEQQFMRSIKKEYYKQRINQRIRYYKDNKLALAVDVLLVATTVMLLDDIDEFAEEYINQEA